MTLLFLIFAVCFNVAAASLIGTGLLIGALICRLKAADRRKRQPSFYLKKGIIFLIVPLIILAGFGIYKGYKAVKYASYETVLDMWRDGEGGYGKEGDRLVKDLLSAADKGDRELFVKHFSNDIKGRKDFDQMIDQFLKDYPGDMSGLEIVRAPVGGTQGKGESLDGGGYITSEYRRYVISGNGRWYYLFVSFVDYTRLADQYLGINRLYIQNAGARALFNLTDNYGSDSDIVCEITDYDPSQVKIIRNDAYEWYETDEPVRTSDEVYDLIVRCKGDIRQVVEELGRPNTVVMENNVPNTFYFKLAPDGDQERFLYVYVNDNWRGSIMVYGNGNDVVRNLLAAYEKSQSDIIK